jgi:hypothetical protein
VALLGGSGAVAAQVPPDKQAIIMLRILAYDHALAARAGAVVRLAVVHGRSSTAVECAARMRAALDDLAPRVVVTGKKLEVETLAAAQVSAAELQRQHLSVLYVCGGSEADLPHIVKAARAAHALTFTDQLIYLARGLSVALSADGARVGISVNLEAARAEGARLAGQLLRASKVVKQ